MNKTIFDEIVAGTIPSWKVWEDEKYLAFLTPVANTPGMTIVIPKVNPGDYIFNLDVVDAQGLIEAATKVAKILERAFGVPKVAMIFEGEGVAHVHAKLLPMHGLQTGKAAASVHHKEFYPEYPGYVTSIDGPRMDDDELTAIQQKIQEAARHEG